MALRIGKSSEEPSRPEYLDSPSENLARIFEYLEEIWPGTKNWQKRLLHTSLNQMQEMQTKGEKIATGFDIIGRTEKEEGVEGGVGSFSFQADLDDESLLHYFNFSKEDSLERSQLVDGLLKTGIEMAKDRYKRAKYVPDDKLWLAEYFDENKEYPRRESVDPTVRLLLPIGDGWGYVDSPLSEVERLLSDRRYGESGQNLEISSLEKLLLEGDIDNVGGMLSESRVMPLDEWEGGERDKEPPWLVLSVDSSKNERDSLIVRDPQMVMHLAIKTRGDNTGIPTMVGTDWAHIAEVGEGALGYTKDWLKKSLDVSVESRLRVRNDAVIGARKSVEQDLGMQIQTEKSFTVVPKFEKRQKKAKKGIDELWSSVVTRFVKIEEVVGIESESVTNDLLIRRGMSELGLYEIDSESELGEWWNKIFLRSSKSYGGMTAMKGIADLLGSGRAPFFMIGNSGSEGLQVGLGVGGVELLGRLRSVIGEMRSVGGSSDLLQSDKSGIYEWWSYWKDSGWRDLYGSEQDAGSNGKGATVSTMAKMVGLMRGVAQGMSARTTKRWASFTQGRSQISAMGRKPELNEAVKKIKFLTAGSKTVGMAEGGIGDVWTRRNYTKDPLLWMETAVDIMKKEGGEGREFAQSLLRQCSESLSADDYRGVDAQIKTEDIKLISSWLLRIDGGKSIREASFGKILTINGEIEGAPVGAYLRGVGENIDSIEEANRLSRVMVHLMTKMLSGDQGKKRYLQDSMVSFVEKKARWNMLHMMELTILERMKGKEIIYGESGERVLRGVGDGEKFGADDLEDIDLLRECSRKWRSWGKGGHYIDGSVDGMVRNLRELEVGYE